MDSKRTSVNIDAAIPNNDIPNHRAAAVAVSSSSSSMSRSNNSNGAISGSGLASEFEMPLLAGLVNLGDDDADSSIKSSTIATSASSSAPLLLREPSANALPVPKPSFHYSDVDPTLLGDQRHSSPPEIRLRKLHLFLRGRYGRASMWARRFIVILIFVNIFSRCHLTNHPINHL
jgi:hypothetical protein